MSFQSRKAIITIELTGASTTKQQNSRRFGRPAGVASRVLEKFICGFQTKERFHCPYVKKPGGGNDISRRRSDWPRRFWHLRFAVRPRRKEMVLRAKTHPADCAVFKDDPHRIGDYNYVTRGSASDLHVFELMGCEGHLPVPVSGLQAQQALTQLAARSAVCANKWAASLLLSAAQYLHCPSSLVTYELIQHI